MSDYYNYTHPYSGTCSKHGAWRGTLDECPQCMNEEARYENHYVPSICWDCCHCATDEPSTTVKCSFNPKLKQLHQIPRKKYCKHYLRMLDYDQHGEL
jgi:hypothetical protein